MPTAENTPTGNVTDRLLGKVKEVAGKVVGNEDLQEEGLLHQDKADAQDRAAREAAAAQVRGEHAEIVARERELEAERTRLAAERAAVAERDRLDRERAVAEQRVEADHARREQTVDRAAEVQEAAVDEAEAAAVRERMAAEAAARAADAAAERARERAAALDPTD
jgi:uncharacterized protein YjbJ (UPF0337 family)